MSSPKPHRSQDHLARPEPRTIRDQPFGGDVDAESPFVVRSAEVAVDLSILRNGRGNQIDKWIEHHSGQPPIEGISGVRPANVSSEEPQPHPEQS
jgi:hypothetical protein